MSIRNMDDYRQTYEAFSLEVPAFYNFGFDVIDRWAEESAKLALISIGQDGRTAHNHTFRDIKEVSNRFANMLRGLGHGEGDRVFVMIPRILPFYAALIGMHKLGAVPMPAATILAPKDCAYRINEARASAAIVHVDQIEKINQIADGCPSLRTLIVVGGPAPGWRDYDSLMATASPALDREEVTATRASDEMIIYFTSGTTKMPKMVSHTHAYALAQLPTAKFWHDLRPEDLHWTLSDTGWAKFAYGKLYGQWTIGAAQVLFDQRGAFDAATHLSLIERLGVTSFCAPPTAYRMLILEDLEKYDFSRLRHATAAGEPLNPEVIRAWREGTGVTIYDGYGQTETVLLVANYPCLEVRPGSMGKPTPGMVVDVVDEDGCAVADGEEGHIAVAYDPGHWPAGLCRGYANDEEASAAAWRGGWYFTGDRGVRDRDGYFWFVGRGDDVINASGYRIGPFEVESALQAHPAVAESAVVGKPDPLRGTIVKAFVVLAPNFTASPALVTELQDFVKRETAPYKYPREIEFRESLPKTVSGKIRRVELRHQEEVKAAQNGHGG